MGCGVIMTVLQNKELIKLQENAIKLSKSNLTTQNQIQNANAKVSSSLLHFKENQPEQPKVEIIKRTSKNNNHIIRQPTDTHLKLNIAEQKKNN